MRILVSAAAIALLAGCTTLDQIGPGPSVRPPEQLTYQLDPVGAGTAPAGVLLRWVDDGDPDLRVWHIYSRGTTAEGFRLRASTTSNTFHDAGVPHLQYYVTAEDLDGFESAPSNTVTIDERLALPRPATLTSTTLDRAIALAWSDEAFQAAPNRFRAYRIYSASYDLDAGLCGATWALEGTTVAPQFLVAALANGVSRCFGVSAVSVEGYESLWSPLRADTPRPDARNVVLYARQVQAGTSGFRFWRDLNGDRIAQAGELGMVGPGTAADIDFVVDRDPSGAFFLVPVRSGTGVELYGSAPVRDLTDVDLAPNQTYRRTPIEALPGWGYVFEMSGGDGFARYGAVRVTHVGRDFLILDWSFQTDPGNPELLIGGGVRAGGLVGRTVAH